MLQDEAHYDNVSMMLRACRAMKQNTATVSEIFSDEWAHRAALEIVGQHAEPRPLSEAVEADIHFAAGYLQATSNVLKLSWAEQLKEAELTEDPWAFDSDGFADDAGTSLVNTDSVVTGILLELEKFRMSQIDEAIAFVEGKILLCKSNDNFLPAYLYSQALSRLKLTKESNS